MDFGFQCRLIRFFFDPFSIGQLPIHVATSNVSLESMISGSDLA